MKKLFCLLLCSILLLSSCTQMTHSPIDSNQSLTEERTEEEKTTIPSPLPTTSQETVTVPATEEIPTEEEIDTFDYPDICDKISWERINEFPIANSSMSTEELRALCVDFFRFAKTFAWTPNADYNFQKNEKGTKDSVKKGTVYGGLPYVGLGSGSVYRIMDYYDPETGVVDIKKAGEDRYLFGNQCSIGAYWGWGRVINSADYRWTYDAVVSRGFVRVGPYTYDDKKVRFTSFANTTLVCQNNGEQVMYESYALLQPADGLVYYTSAGHIIMCSSVAHVVRNEDGTINGKESYIYQIDQSQSWKEKKQSDGSPILVKSGVDTKRTFKDMFDDSYIPFTFKEFLGEDPVEDAVCTFSHKGETITIKEMKSAVVEANYGISDTYLIVKDEAGNEHFRLPIRSKQAGKMKVELESEVLEAKWEAFADGTYDLEVLVQLSNGTRPTVFRGKIVS